MFSPHARHESPWRKARRLGGGWYYLFALIETTWAAFWHLRVLWLALVVVALVVAGNVVFYRVFLPWASGC